MDKKQAALVLSGGGSLGLAHVGALKKLEKAYCFSHYFGVSAGAIVCAAHACGKSADEISQLVHSMNLFSLAFDFSSTDFGILRGEKITQFLEILFDNKTFEDIRSEGKHLFLYATDFVTGDRISFTSGSIASAVRASLSVPLLFEPLYYQEKWLVDGGLSGNFPLMEAIQEYHGEAIIGVDVATGLKDIDFSQNKFFGKPKSLRQTVERTFRIFFKTQQLCIPKDPRVHCYYPDLTDFTTLDVNKWEQIEQKGFESVISH